VRRVVVHEVALGAGVALLLIAVLATGIAQRALGRYERDVGVARAAVDSITAVGRKVPGSAQAARRLAEAEFNVRASRELRARLWRPGGMGMTTTVVGLAVLGAGVGLWRRSSRRDALALDTRHPQRAAGD